MGGLGPIGGGILGTVVGGPVGGLLGAQMGQPGYSPSMTPQESPMNTLMMTGGAPLLANIGMGVDPDQALASYLGMNKTDLINELKGNSKNLGLSDQEKTQLTSLRGQLNQISQNTDMRNQAVQKLVNDFPNFMQQHIQQFQGVADASMKQSLDLASNQLAAKYASTGGFSSGAFNQGLARASQEQAMNKLNYATGLSGQAFQQQLGEAEALRSFQQKMLGGGADQGYLAIQNMLGRNQQSSLLHLLCAT